MKGKSSMKNTVLSPEEKFIKATSSAVREFDQAILESEYEQDQKDIEAFDKLLESETRDAYESYKQAKREYEAVYKKFLVKHVTGSVSFDHHYEEAWNSAVNNLYPEVAMSLVDDLHVYEYIISDHYWWIQEGRYLSEGKESDNENL